MSSPSPCILSRHLRLPAPSPTSSPPVTEPSRTSRILASSPPPAGRTASLARLWAVPRCALDAHVALSPSFDDSSWLAMYNTIIAPRAPNPNDLSDPTPPQARGFHSPESRLFRLLSALSAPTSPSAVSRDVLADVITRALSRRHSPLFEKNMPLAVEAVLFCLDPDKRVTVFSAASLRRSGLAGALRRFELQNEMSGPFAVLEPTRFAPLLRDLADVIDDSEQREGAGYGVSGCSLAGGGGSSVGVPGVTSPHCRHEGCVGAVISKGAVLRYAERRDLLTRRAVCAVFARHGSLVKPRPRGVTCDFVALHKARAAQAAKADGLEGVEMKSLGSATDKEEAEATRIPVPVHRSCCSSKADSRWSVVTDSSSSSSDDDCDDGDASDECGSSLCNCTSGSTASSVVSIPSPLVGTSSVAHADGRAVFSASGEADLEHLDMELELTSDEDEADDSDEPPVAVKPVPPSDKTRTAVEAAGLVEVLSSLDFVRLYLALIKCGTDVGVRYWFSVLDVDNDGFISKQDGHHFYGERRRDGEKRQPGTVLCELDSVWTRVVASVADPTRIGVRNPNILSRALSVPDVLRMAKTDREFLLCALLIRRVDDVQLVDVAATDKLRLSKAALDTDKSTADLKAAANASRPPLPPQRKGRSTQTAARS